MAREPGGDVIPGTTRPRVVAPPPAARPPAPVAPPPYRPPAPPPKVVTPHFAGAGPYSSWGNVPGGEQNVLSDLRNQFENLIGFTTDIPQKMLLAMANQHVLTLDEFSRYADGHGIKLDDFPWAKHGLDKEQYTATATIYATEYKKVTGQDISQDALQQAFRNPRDPTGSLLLTGSQYQQQLMQDANIQKTYGWVKYGMDYSAWQAQKLGMRTQLGREVNDSEAAALLQYNTQARGSNQAVVARVPQQQPSVGATGISGSLVR